jgi:hypothetical protein
MRFVKPSDRQALIPFRVGGLCNTSNDFNRCGVLVARPLRQIVASRGTMPVERENIPSIYRL